MNNYELDLLCLPFLDFKIVAKVEKEVSGRLLEHNEKLIVAYIILLKAVNTSLPEISSLFYF